MGRKMTNSDRDKVLVLLDKGLKAKEIGQVLGWEQSTVHYINRFAQWARKGDMESLEKNKEMHLPVYLWITEKYNLGGAKVVEKEPNEMQANDKLFFDVLVDLLAEIKQTNELLRELK